ncbi:MAG: Arabinose operon regulatory protein [Lentisphaerae bacterium ADurb.Bin082]|nr:MAG: Arabinose operon regulatory protein [Lentisphaerae bacterium ADurb.Bin082]
MKVIHDADVIRKKFFSNPATAKRFPGMVLNIDYGDFEHVEASPAYDNYMLYADIVNQYHLQKNHLGTLLQPSFLSVRYITSGSQYVRCKDKIFLAEPGDLMLIPPQCSYSYATGPEGHCFQQSITMKGTLLNSILAHLGFAKDFCIHLENPEFYFEIHQRLKELLKYGKADECEKNSSLCFFLLQRIANLSDTLRPPELLIQAQHYIEQNLGENLSLKVLAEHLHKCPSTLNKLFKKHLNFSVYQYIISRRMECALRMLRRKEHSIKYIASVIGYSSLSNFSTEFKKYYKCTPRDYALREMNLMS